MENTITNRQKCAWTYFHIVANKGLIWIITASRINLFAAAIFLHIKLCNMHRVYCLNYILNEWEVKFKNTYFFMNAFLNKRIWIIRYFQTRCQLSKFTIRDKPFKTIFTWLFNMQGLNDSASLKHHQNNDYNTRGHNFWVVYSRTF